MQRKKSTGQSEMTQKDPSHTWPGTFWKANLGCVSCAAIGGPEWGGEVWWQEEGALGREGATRVGAQKLEGVQALGNTRA